MTFQLRSFVCQSGFATYPLAGEVVVPGWSKSLTTGRHRVIVAEIRDSAFHPKDARRSLIKGWIDMLADMLADCPAPDSTKPLVEHQLAGLLYWAVYDRLLDLQKRLT